MTATPTPFNMPKRAPKHTWTPPIDHVETVAVPMPVATPKANNAKTRRAQRNGWHTN